MDLYGFFQLLSIFAQDDVVPAAEDLPDPIADEKDLEEDHIDAEHVSVRVSVGFKSLRSRSSTGK